MEDIIIKSPYLSALPDKVNNLLIKLSKESIRFSSWFSNNQTKILSKIRGAKSEEDLYDVLTELRCASFLLTLDEVIDLQYEPLHQVQQSPDFKVITKIDGEVYFEVRRIRKNLSEFKRDEFTELFWIKAKQNIHRNFGLSLNIGAIEGAGIFEQLIQKIDGIIGNIDSILSKLPEDIGAPIELTLDEFADGLEIYISSIPEERRIHNEIRKYGGLFRTPYSGNEDRKFGDIIFEKTRQLLEGEKNIIFIYADNETHEVYDMMDSIHLINQLLTETNEEVIQKKGYISAEDFLVKSQRISGIFLLTSRQERHYWHNKNSLRGIDSKLMNELEGIS